MKLKPGQFGFWMLIFVGYCGEVPVSLVRRMDGYYDHNRRVVTHLVREGYLRERRFRAEQRHVVRSLSLTDAGLRQIQHLSPNQAGQIRKHLFAPKDGQGNWSRTQRLHRGAACLLAAMQLGALWAPGKAKDAAIKKRLVYYSTYQFNKSGGKDNKSARASGVLLTEYRYFPVYYLGERNMRWSTEAEQQFRDRFEQSELGHGLPFGGNLLLGENWDLAERLLRSAGNPRSRLIRFSAKDLFYYTALDDRGMKLLHAIVDEDVLFRLQQWLKARCGCPVSTRPDYLFLLDFITEPAPFRQKKYFFDFQMPIVRSVYEYDSELVSMSSEHLDAFDAEGGEADDSGR